MSILKKTAGTAYFLYAMLLFIATMLVIFPFVWCTTLFPEPRRAQLLHPIFRVWMGVYLPLIFCPVRRKGKEHFKKGQHYVVVINHNSLADIPVSSPWIPGPNKTLAKIEMARIPIFGVIYKAGSILVDRKKEASRRESFTAMQDMLEKGIHLCLYPEGTRNKSNQPLQSFYDGAFIAAIRAQVPIIPAVIFNTKKIYPPTGSPIQARPKTIHFHFLPPIDTKGLGMTDVATLKANVRQTMEQYLLTNQDRL